MTVKKAQRLFFQQRLLAWNDQVNTRQMPWKGESDPYKIWLSEVILQQTRVEQGLPYYERFIARYPTIGALADANDQEVFKLWEGLGYYSRCRNLLAAARQLKNEYEGQFPKNYRDILQLKGVGNYTASAIASFAFGLPHAVIDGNVIRVLARFFGISTPFDTTAGKKLFSQLAQQLLETGKPAAYNQAIMDFGATVCRPKLPLCGQCPLNAGCFSSKNKQVQFFPVRSKKLIKKKRWLLYLVISNDEKLLIRERKRQDIWKNLHEFYLVEDEAAFEWSDDEVLQELAYFEAPHSRILARSPTYRQELTHQTVYARFINVELSKTGRSPDDYRWVQTRDLEILAFPGIIKPFLEKLSPKPMLLF